MKLITFVSGGNTTSVGIVQGKQVIDVPRCAKIANIAAGFSNIRMVLDDPAGIAKVNEVLQWTKKNNWNDYNNLDELRVLAPINNPEKILGAAANYYDACERSGIPVPDVLKTFGKFPPAVNHPGGTVEIGDHEVTWEGELGVVIGCRGRNIPAKDAFNHVGGYTIINDVTAIDCMAKDIQMLRGKSYDGFLPMGPVFVTAGEIENPKNLEIKTTLNGDLVQDSNTGKIIVDIPHLIEYFSSFLTLVPGDIIATGTPGGTATHFDPPRFLRDGDTIEITIENIGTLKSIFKR